VERAAQSQGTRRCRRCGHVIASGERYHYLDHWRAERSYWCGQHMPRPSDMVVSPNKRRLYLAQEALIDAVGASGDHIVTALEAAIQEAMAVAIIYADRDPEKQNHIDAWVDELERLLVRLKAGEAQDPRTEVLEAAQRATIFDNWFYPEQARSAGFG